STLAMLTASRPRLQFRKERSRTEPEQDESRGSHRSGKNNFARRTLSTRDLQEDAHRRGARRGCVDLCEQWRSVSRSLRRARCSGNWSLPSACGEGNQRTDRESALLFQSGLFGSTRARGAEVGVNCAIFIDESVLLQFRNGSERERDANGAHGNGAREYHYFLRRVSWTHGGCDQRYVSGQISRDRKTKRAGASKSGIR